MREPVTAADSVRPAGTLTAADLGRTVRFRHEAATYEGRLTAVQHRTYGIGDDGPTMSMLSVRNGEWYAHKNIDATEPVTIVADIVAAADVTGEPGSDKILS